MQLVGVERLADRSTELLGPAGRPRGSDELLEMLDGVGVAVTLELLGDGDVLTPLGVDDESVEVEDERVDHGPMVVDTATPGQRFLSGPIAGGRGRRRDRPWCAPRLRHGRRCRAHGTRDRKSTRLNS